MHNLAGACQTSGQLQSVACSGAAPFRVMLLAALPISTCAGWRQGMIQGKTSAWLPDHMPKLAPQAGLTGSASCNAGPQHE